MIHIPADSYVLFSRRRRCIWLYDMSNADSFLPELLKNSHSYFDCHGHHPTSYQGKYVNSKCWTVAMGNTPLLLEVVIIPAKQSKTKPKFKCVGVIYSSSAIVLNLVQHLAWPHIFCNPFLLFFLNHTQFCLSRTYWHVVTNFYQQRAEFSTRYLARNNRSAISSWQREVKWFMNVSVFIFMEKKRHGLLSIEW